MVFRGVRLHSHFVSLGQGIHHSNDVPFVIKLSTQTVFGHTRECDKPATRYGIGLHLYSYYLSCWNKPLITRSVRARNEDEDG